MTEKTEEQGQGQAHPEALASEIVRAMRYTAALRCEAAAVRFLTELMSASPVPEQAFESAKHVYEQALLERREALADLEKSGALKELIKKWAEHASSEEKQGENP